MKPIRSILPFFLLLISCDSNKPKTAATRSADQKNKTIDAARGRRNISAPGITSIIGTWMKNCEDGGGHISISSLSDEATIEVNSNQIVIGASIDTSGFQKNRLVVFRLTSPGELGAGGLNLNWDDFSRDSVVATLQLSDATSGLLTWYGFYDTKRNKRIWQDNFSMLLDDSGKAIKNNVSVVNSDHSVI